MHSSMGTGAASNSAAFLSGAICNRFGFRLGHHIIGTASRAELPHTFFTVINIRSKPIINHSAAALHKHNSMYEHVIHHIYAAVQAEDRHYFVYNTAAHQEKHIKLQIVLSLQVVLLRFFRRGAAFVTF